MKDYDVDDLQNHFARKNMDTSLRKAWTRIRRRLELAEAVVSDPSNKQRVDAIQEIKKILRDL